MNIGEYIDARLYVLIPVLYCVGVAVKKSRICDWLIPYILGVLGITLATAYLLATDAPVGGVGVLGVIFSGVTQGVLCASASVYIENLIKQAEKRNSAEGDGFEDDENDM